MAGQSRRPARWRRARGRTAQRLARFLAPEQALLPDLLASSPVGMALLDRELRYREVNDVLAQMNGIPAEEHRGRTPMELLPGIDPEQYLPALRAALAGAPGSTMLAISGETPAAPGRLRHWEESMFAVRDRRGSIRGVGVVAVDVTERTETEQALRRQEATARLILQSAPNGMLLVDGDGAILAVNPEAQRLFGYDDGELVGRPVETLVPERARRGHPALREAFHDDPLTRGMGHGRDLTARRKDGSEFPVEVGLAVAPGAPGLVTCVVSDISERKLVEDELATLLDSERAARDRLARLQGVTETGLAQLPPERLLPELLERVMVALGGDSATLLLLEEDRSSLVVRASIGVPSRGDPDRIPAGAGVAGRVARTGRPAIVHDMEDVAVRRERLEAAGIVSLVAVPLVVEGQVIGVLDVGSRRHRRFQPSDLELMEPVAARVAMAVDRAQAFERERGIAEALQRGLLPEVLPDVDGAALAVRYFAGTSGLMVGGDWYDVLALPSGAVLLVIGDVMGRGVRAASVMGQLRSALRIYLQLGLPLTEVVARLNDTVLSLGESEMATMLLVEVRPETGEVTSVCAGHLPAVVRRPDGTATLLDTDSGIALGVLPGARFELAASRLEPGGSVLLYTDGLIERPDADLATQLDALVAAAARAPLDADAACDALVARFLPLGQQGDDVALLGLRLDRWGVPPLELALHGGGQELRRARRTLRDWLQRAGAAPDEAADVLLAVSEALNSHGVVASQEEAQDQRPEAWHLRVTLHDAVVEAVLEVSDPVLPPEGTDRGRGLVVMEAVSDEFAVRREGPGRQVRVVRRLLRHDRRAEEDEDQRGLLLVPEPAGVPVARRYVRHRLAGRPAELVDAGELCVSELVTNAVVHAGTEVEVRLLDTEQGEVCLEVRDGVGGLPQPHGHTERATTGRGLELVARLSSSWGVRPLAGGGKAVWCVLSGAGLDAADPEDLVAAWDDDWPTEDLTAGEPAVGEPPPGPAARGGERQAALLAVPLPALVRAREHLDALVRECVLLSPPAPGPRSGPAPRPAGPHGDLVALVEGLRGRWLSQLTVLERQWWSAAEQGRATVDLHVPCPTGVVAGAEQWRQALAQLDDLAVRGELLTSPMPADVADLVAWVLDELQGQAQGRPGRPYGGSAPLLRSTQDSEGRVPSS